MPDAHFGARGSVTPPADGSGNTPIPDMFNVPLDAEGAKKVSEGGTRLKELASTGGFAVNEAGFQAYLKACNFFLDGYKAMKRDLSLLNTAAPMGSSEYSKKVATYNVTVAAGHSDSMIPVLDQMLDGIQKAIDAIKIARSNYRENDDAQKVSFSKIGKEPDGQ